MPMPNRVVTAGGVAACCTVLSVLIAACGGGADDVSVREGPAEGAQNDPASGADDQPRTDRDLASDDSYVLDEQTLDDYLRDLTREHVAAAEARAEAAANGTSPDYAVEIIRSRLAMMDTPAFSSLSLVGFLPNITYRGLDGRTDTASRTVVLGEFERAEPGRGLLAVDENLELRSTEVAFDDPSATSVTVHVHFTQDEVLAGEDLSEDGALTLPMVAPAGTDAAAFGESLRALGPVVVFVDDAAGLGPATDSSPRYRVAGMDGLVATVGPEGNLAMPFFDEATEATLLADSANVDDLRGAADRAAQPVVDLPW